MSDEQYAFGVVYTPATISSCDHEIVRTPFSLPALDQLGVAWIRVFWLDFTNVLRVRILSRSFFKKLLNSARPGIPIAKVTFGVVHLTLAEGFSSAGEYLYVFDTGSFRLCPYAPGHASVMGFFQLKTPPPSVGLTPIPLCPHGLLKRIVDDAQANAGVSFLIGYESEFTLLRSTSPIVTVNDGDYSTAAKLPGGAVESIVLEEIANGLEEAGIEVQQYHGEAAPGQGSPLAPLEAADALVNTRELIYNVANKHGLRATFAPRLHKHSCGNASHTHISVHNTGPPPRPAPDADADAALAPTLTTTERSFLQGVLAHLPAICALALPTPHSYARVQDGIWAGGTSAAWGTDNREAAVRLAGARGAHHFEVRVVDATANPFLALAAVVAAGARGIADKLPLESGDCGKAVAQMTQGERRALGVHDAARLPRSIEEARKALDADGELKAMLGYEFVSEYLKVNKLLGDNLVLDSEEATLQKLANFY